MNLTLNTIQKTVLSQKMMQSAKILQMSTAELLEYINVLSVENPVIEYEEGQESELKTEMAKKRLDWLDSTDEQNKTYYYSDVEDKDANDSWKFIDEGMNLKDYLMFQANAIQMDELKRAVVHYIIEDMDENGYIDDPIEKISKRINVSEQIMEDALKTVQKFEPVGIGARDLKECLLLQLTNLPKKNLLAERIVLNELAAFGKNQLKSIASRLKAPLKDVNEAGEIIKSLNPKPGNSYYSKKNLEYIIPDIIIEKKGTGFNVVLNDSYQPKIKISSYYKDIVCDDVNTDTKDYVCEKIRQAEWAIKCISKRNQTLLKTSEAILEVQKDFFLLGPGNIKPMKLNDIAKIIGSHESTVSRAVSDKYLQCSFGVFPLGVFFNHGIEKDNLQDTSSESVKHAIKAIINAENSQNPLSDRKIGEELNKEGINISRRTIAKYRENMNIPSASGRKSYM
ncbi:MAG: RNA polymerase factor sigma-54 [Lachnospiraceae bacterium]|nr:RNA polymerase factor sigma-54 [Lachnospiraceae bacterium]